MRKILLAPDSFKGSLSAADVAESLAEGWQLVDPHGEFVFRPIADGGEGTLDAIESAVPGAQRVEVTVDAPAGSDPGAPIRTSWLRLPPEPGAPLGTAVVELANTAGIELYGDALRPWDASTYAFGQAIRSALEADVSRIYLAIGSSASTDGGAGLLAALGARFEGGPADGRIAARHLQDLTSADLSGLLPRPPGGAIILTDVNNPLIGERGAAKIFGPQKGLTSDEALRLDETMGAYARVIGADPMVAGAGAAGGAGYALHAWGARTRSGASAVGELVGLRAAIRAASLVITGEGSYDGQSAEGKGPFHVAHLASTAGVEVALVAGGVSPSADTTRFAGVVSLSDLAGSVAAAISEPRRWLRLAGAESARRFLGREDGALCL